MFQIEMEAEGEEVEILDGNPSIHSVKGTVKLYHNRHDVEPEPFMLPPTRSLALLLFGFPSDMSVGELLTYFEGYFDRITHIKVVQEVREAVSQFLLLVAFSVQEMADQFYLQYHGQKYNSLESHCIQLAFIRNLSIEGKNMGVAEMVQSARGSFREIPHCSVCLERLEPASTGILTTVCNHSFHCHCWSKWDSDSACPVCRYQVRNVHRNEFSRCMQCNQDRDLWMCLICGEIGCGRYQEGHANDHFLATSHTFAMELDSQRVWDYAADAFVHRVVRDYETGKLVTIGHESEGETKMHMLESKREALHSEYDRLIHVQLASQRLYFEEEQQKTLEKHQEALRRREKERQGLQERMTRKLEKVEKQNGKLADDNKNLQALNKHLLASHKIAKDKIKEMEAQMAEQLEGFRKEKQQLEEQVRDLMFFVENREVIANSEAQDGQLIIKK